MDSLRICCSIFLFFVTVHCMVTDLQRLEDEFLKTGVGSEKNKTWTTLFVNWTEDRQAALCERALNDTEQFIRKNADPANKNKTEIWPTFELKTVEFKAEKPKHASVKATIMKCPNGKYIYESGRLNDCYVIMTEEKSLLSIQKEVCDIGIM